MFKRLINSIGNFIKNYNSYKLRMNLLTMVGFFALIILISIMVFGNFTIKKSLKYNEKEKIRSIESELTKTAVKFNEEINSMDDITNFIYNKYFSNVKKFMIYNNEESSFKSFDKNVLDAIFDLNRDISGFTILTRTGATFSYYNPYSPYYYNSNKESYMKAILDKKNEYNNNLIIKHINYENYGEYIQFIRMNDSSNNDLFSMIVLEKNIGEIRKWLKGFDINKEGKIILINEKGHIVYTNGDYRILDNVITKNNLLEKLNLSSGIEKIIIDENENYIFYNKSVYYGCNLIVIMPVKYIESNYPLSFLFRYYALILIGFILIVFIYFRKTILNPIFNLESALHQISEGEIGSQLNINKNSELYPISQEINNVLRKFQDLIDKEYATNLLKKQAELDALQSQINPHFLYNTLESIRGHALYEGVDNIAQMADSLSRLFRYSVSKKNNLVTFKEELFNVDNYLLIQKYCYQDRFKIIKTIDQDSLKYKVPKLCIQPIVENAIKHGLETKLDKGIIKISAYNTKKRLIITIEDNGIGITEEKVKILNQRLTKKRENILLVDKKGDTSIGIENVNERIKLYFGDEYGIKIFSTYGIGTIVEMTLPLIKEDYNETYHKNW